MAKNRGWITKYTNTESSRNRSYSKLRTSMVCIVPWNSQNCSRLDYGAVEQNMDTHLKSQNIILVYSNRVVVKFRQR